MTWSWLLILLSPLASIGAGVCLGALWAWLDRRRVSETHAHDRLPAHIRRAQAHSDDQLQDLIRIVATFKRAAQSQAAHPAITAGAYEYSINATDRYLRGERTS